MKKNKKILNRHTILLASVLTIAMPCIGHAKNVALLVGVGNYQDDLIDKLDGPTHDVTALKDILIKNWQFKPKNITTLLEEQATHKNILKALNQLKSKSSAGDEVLIYFSGHGTSTHDENFGALMVDALSGDTGAFLPYDVNSEKLATQINVGNAVKAIQDNLITGQYHFRPILSVLDKDRHVTAIMDACFSGSGFRTLTPLPFKNRQVFLPDLIGKSAQKLHSKTTKNATDNSQSEAYPYRQAVTIGASSKKQPAADISQQHIEINPSITFDSKPHGMFTDALLRVLSGDNASGGADGIVSYSELENSVTGILKTQTQTPQFQPYIDEPTSHNLMSRPLFGNTRSLVRKQKQIAPIKVKVLNHTQAFNKLLKTPKHQTKKMVMVDTGADFLVEKTSNKKSGKTDAQWTLKTATGLNIIKNTTLSNIHNRLLAAHWLKKIKTNVKNKNTLRFSALPAQNGNSFIKGDVLQFAVKASADSAFLIFSVNGTGHVNVLYQSLPTDNVMFDANQLVKIPSDGMIEVHPPYGAETVVLVSLKNKLSEQERGRIAKLFNSNQENQHSGSIAHLTNLISAKATGISELTLKTFEN